MRNSFRDPMTRTVRQAVSKPSDATCRRWNCRFENRHNRVLKPILLFLYVSLTLFGCSESDERNQNSGNLSIDGYNHVTTFGNGEVIRGSGNVEEQVRNLERFSALEVQMAADVKIVQVSKPSVTVIADDNLQPIMSTEVIGETLHLTAKQSFATNTNITFVVSVPVIERIAIKGSGEMFLENVTKDDLQLSIEGSGSVGGIGTVESFNATIHGSGDLLLERLQSQHCSVTINGSGDAAVHAGESLTATINGSGSVTYSGQPNKVEPKVNGSGDIRPLE